MRCPAPLLSQPAARRCTLWAAARHMLPAHRVADLALCQSTGPALHVSTRSSLIYMTCARRLKEKDNLRERLADAEDRGIPFLIFFGDQELAKARPTRSAPCCRSFCNL